MNRGLDDGTGEDRFIVSKVVSVGTRSRDGRASRGELRNLRVTRMV